MIPISLTLKGLYSYQQAQTIEFDRLIEGQLFGIFGSVGSGKSSILEAISFALYGQTERLDNRDNRNYNMMNLKSNELLIDFSFQNYDGQLYRYTVKGKRHGKDFDKVNTFERVAYHWLHEAWVPLESAMAEKVIGLSYDNFRRTIIIPQGKFQEFLQLGHSQRTQMLKEIFQLEKFEFFNQTRNLESKNNSAIQHLTGKISTYTDIQQEKIDEKQNELAALTDVLANKRKSFELKTEALSGLSVLKILMESLHAQQGLVFALQREEESFLLLGQKIKEADYCVGHFKNGLDLLAERKVKISGIKKSILETEVLLEGAKDQIANLSIELNGANEEFLKQDAYKERLQDYQYMMGLLTLKADIDKYELRIEKGEIVISEVAVKKEACERNRVLIKAELQEKNNQMPDVTELVNLRAWFDQKSNLEKILQNSLSEKERLEQEESKRPRCTFCSFKEI